MNKFTIIVTAVFIWMGPGLATGFAQVHSTVVNAKTGQPVPQVHVYWKSQLKHHRGTVTNANGQFKLQLSPLGVDTLIVKAVGYQTMKLIVRRQSPRLPHPIKLHPKTYELANLIVLDNKRTSPQQRKRWGAADWLNRKYANTSLAKRGPHAAEILIRGLSSDRVNTRVNNVPIFSACVDKMDPVTSYLNLSSIKGLARSGDPLGVPGTMNIRLKKPKYHTGWTGTLHAGYQTSIQQPKINATLNYGSRHWAWKITGFWMQAQNLVAGGEKVIDNSQQHQLNGNTTLRYHQGNHEVELHMAYNNSWDIGYPALLMDAEKALFYLGSLEYTNHPGWEGVSAISTKIYANRVEHVMNDYNRDVANREVMRNMHMPMEGYTETLGIRQQWSGRFGPHSWQGTIELFRVDAFGNMSMESLFESVPDMYLINLGDIRTYSAGFDLSWNYQMDRQNLLSLKTGLQFKDRTVRRASSARYLETEFGQGAAQRSDIAWNAQLQLTHTFDQDWKLAASVSTRYRVPTYKELFGYYIYNYEDGFFYLGNPTLDTEQHYTFDLLFSIDRNRVSVELITYVDFVRNWISGTFAEGFAGQHGNYQFKQYKNTDNALLTGANLQVMWHLANHWHLTNQVQFTYGQHLGWNEPLRMIPPLNGNLTLQYHQRKWSVSADLKWAAAQTRIARDHSIENTTPTYQIINLRGAVNLASSIKLRVQLHNLFDIYYWTHTSIGDIPSRGRTVQVSLHWSF